MERCSRDESCKPRVGHLMIVRICYVKDSIEVPVVFHSALELDEMDRTA